MPPNFYFTTNRQESENTIMQYAMDTLYTAQVLHCGIHHIKNCALLNTDTFNQRQSVIQVYMHVDNSHTSHSIRTYIKKQYLAQNSCVSFLLSSFPLYLYLPLSQTAEGSLRRSDQVKGAHRYWYQLHKPFTDSHTHTAAVCFPVGTHPVTQCQPIQLKSYTVVIVFTVT